MFRKRTDIISGKVKNLDSLSSLKSYIGKRVYSKNGDLLGHVKDALFKGNVIEGILVKGKRKLFISKEFFEHESDKAFVLSIDPIVSLIGKLVYDSTGKKIGRVVDIKRKTNANTFTELVIKKSIFRRRFTIPKEDISVAKKNIILKSEL